MNHDAWMRCSASCGSTRSEQCRAYVELLSDASWLVRFVRLQVSDWDMRLLVRYLAEVVVVANSTRDRVAFDV